MILPSMVVSAHWHPWTDTNFKQRFSRTRHFEISWNSNLISGGQSHSSALQNTPSVSIFWKLIALITSSTSTFKLTCPTSTEKFAPRASCNTSHLLAVSRSTPWHTHSEQPPRHTKLVQPLSQTVLPRNRSPSKTN